MPQRLCCLHPQLLQLQPCPRNRLPPPLPMSRISRCSEHFEVHVNSTCWRESLRNSMDCACFRARAPVGGHCFGLDRLLQRHSRGSWSVRFIAYDSERREQLSSVLPVDSSWYNVRHHASLLRCGCGVVLQSFFARQPRKISFICAVQLRTCSASVKQPQSPSSSRPAALCELFLDVSHY